MQKNSLLTLLLIFVVAFASRCQAVVIYPKDNPDEPIVGFFVSETDSSLVIQQVTKSGKGSPRTFAKSEIDYILTVDRERLNELDPADAKDYRDYAEELSEKKQDPEARETAIRLYLIAADLDGETLGRSSLLGMISLARDANEESKFRAMAYLLDPEHDERVLRRPNPVKNRPKSISEKGRLGLLDTLRKLRQGYIASARRSFELQETREAIAFFGDILTVEELDSYIKPGRLSPTLLKRFLLIELSLLPNAGDIAPPMVDSSTTSWFDAINRDGKTPVPTLSLKTLTEWNPKECVYRNNKWSEE